MKKMFSIVLSILFASIPSINVYATNCPDVSIDIDELDFSKAISKKRTWDVQTINGIKKAEIVTYEEMPTLKEQLSERLKDASRNLAYAWNGKAGIKAIFKISTSLLNIVTKNIFGINLLSADESIKKLTDIAKDENLSDEDIISQINRMEENLVLSQEKGALSAAGATVDAAGDALKKGTITSVATAAVTSLGAKVVTGSLLTLSTTFLVAGGIGCAVGLIVYDLICSRYDETVSEMERTATNDLVKSMRLFNRAGEEVKNHNWLNNNVLIMTTLTAPQCQNVDLKFKNVPNVNYNNWNDIYEGIAKAKCKFLNNNTKSCQKKVLDEIKCLIKKKDRLSCIKDDSEYMSNFDIYSAYETE